jgi:hypothetical protein
MLEAQTMDDQTNSDDFDPKLEALFKRDHTHVPAEPFVNATLRAVAAARRRAAWKTRLVAAAAIVGVVLLSPQLVAGSVWMSSRLDDVFAVASSWLSSPYGMAAAVLAALAGFVARRPLAALATKWVRSRPGF